MKSFIMKMRQSLLAFCLVAVPGFAQEFYVDWAGDSARLDYSPSNAYQAGLPWGVDVYWNSDRDLLSGLYLATPFEGSGFTAWLFSAEVALFYLSLDDADASTAGVSVSFSAGYKFLTPMPTSLIFTAEVSPDILNTGSDIEQLNQFSGRLQTELSPYLRGYLGYRLYSVDFDQVRFKHKDNFDFEDSFFLGFSLLF